MKPIKCIVLCLLAFIFLTFIWCCNKKESLPTPKPLADSVAQGPSFRMGKWYSVSNGAGFNFTSNPLLDTIWFISDSIAGWTGFGGNPYVYWPTYFSDPYHIVYVAPGPLNASKLDTDIHECGMTTNGDTFVIYWPTNNYQVFAEHYVKVKN